MGLWTKDEVNKLQSVKQWYMRPLKCLTNPPGNLVKRFNQSYILEGLSQARILKLTSRIPVQSNSVFDPQSSIRTVEGDAPNLQERPMFYCFFFA